MTGKPITGDIGTAKTVHAPVNVLAGTVPDGRRAGVSSTPLIDSPGILTGKQVGEYTIGSKICCNVFTATNPRGKEILVKLLDATENSLKPDSGEGDRFTDQAKIIAENILPVQLIGVQHLSDGEAVILMDITRGKSLGEAASSWGVSRSEIAECASQAARLFVDTEKAIGTNIAGFTVTRLVGMGGMGSVFLAENKDMGGTIAAVKIIQPSTGHPIDHLEARFKREATALAQLRDNQNVVSIITMARVEDTLYLVMDYARGKGLDYVISKSDEGIRLTMAEVRNISSQLCSALMDAHQKGIAHRDIKPENIKVDAYGRIKILDFGLAKVSSANLPAKLTRSTAFMGTPDYMPPDHMMITDPKAADVYAAGVTVFMMLAGKKVYTGHEEGREDLRKLPPSLRDHGVTCGDRLNEVMQKAVSKQLIHRYQSIAEFWRDLDSALRLEISNEAVTVAKTERPSNIGLVINTTKKLLVSAAVAGLVSVTGAFLLSAPLLSGVAIGATVGLGLAAFHSLIQWQPENLVFRLIKSTTLSTMAFSTVGAAAVAALGGFTLPAAILGAQYGLILGAGVGITWPIISWPFKSATNFLITSAAGAAVLTGFLLFGPKLPSVREIRRNIVEVAVGARASGNEIMGKLDADISGAEVDVHQFGDLRVKSTKGINHISVQKRFKDAQDAFTNFARSRLPGVSSINGELVVVVAHPDNLSNPEIQSIVAQKGWAYIPPKTFGNAELSSGVVYLAEGSRKAVYTAVAGASMQAAGVSEDISAKNMAKFLKSL
ncbi:MAG: protein kinase [Candidatus Micrarchaeota archaeon]